MQNRIAAPEGVGQPPVMSDSAPVSGTTTPSIPITAPARATVLDAARLHAALGNELRFAIVKLLADGRSMSVAMLAKHFAADYENVSKHCRLLLHAGVLGLRADGDGRCRWYEIPPAVRVAPGVLDYGVCVLRLG